MTELRKLEEELKDMAFRAKFILTNPFLIKFRSTETLMRRVSAVPEASFNLGRNMNLPKKEFEKYGRWLVDSITPDPFLSAEAMERWSIGRVTPYLKEFVASIATSSEASFHSYYSSKVEAIEEFKDCRPLLGSAIAKSYFYSIQFIYKIDHIKKEDFYSEIACPPTKTGYRVMSLSDKDMKRLEEVCGHIEQLPLNERRRAVKSFDANIGRVIDSKELDKWVDVVLEHFEESNAIGGDTYDRAV